MFDQDGEVGHILVEASSRASSLPEEPRFSRAVCSVQRETPA